MNLGSKKRHKFPLLLYTAVGKNFNRADECSLSSRNTGFSSLGLGISQNLAATWNLRNTCDTTTQDPWSISKSSISIHAAWVHLIFRKYLHHDDWTSILIEIRPHLWQKDTHPSLYCFQVICDTQSINVPQLVCLFLLLFKLHMGHLYVVF